MDDESKVREEILQFMEEYSRGELFITESDSNAVVKEKTTKLWSFLVNVAKNNPYTNQVIKDDTFNIISLKSEVALGTYDHVKNELTINLKDVFNLLSLEGSMKKNHIDFDLAKKLSKYNLMMLLTTIGHETRHYYQNKVRFILEDKTLTLNEIVQKSQKALMSNLLLDPNEFKKLFSVLKNNASNEYFEEFKKKNKKEQIELCEKLTRGQYLQMAHEEDARDVSYDFVQKFLTEIEKDASNDLKKLIVELKEMSDGERERDLKEREQFYPFFDDYYQALKMISKEEVLLTEKKYKEKLSGITGINQIFKRRLLDSVVFNKILQHIVYEQCKDMSFEEIKDYCVSTILTNGSFTFPLVLNELINFDKNQEENQIAKSDILQAIINAKVDYIIISYLYKKDFFSNEEYSNLLEDLLKNKNAKSAKSLLMVGSIYQSFDENVINKSTDYIFDIANGYLSKLKTKDKELDVESFQYIYDLITTMLSQYNIEKLSEENRKKMENLKKQFKKLDKILLISQLKIKQKINMVKNKNKKRKDQTSNDFEICLQ